jgi:hypothetical protein
MSGQTARRMEVDRQPLLPLFSQELAQPLRRAQVDLAFGRDPSAA